MLDWTELRDTANADGEFRLHARYLVLNFAERLHAVIGLEAAAHTPGGADPQGAETDVAPDIERHGDQRHGSVVGDPLVVLGVAPNTFVGIPMAAKKRLGFAGGAR